MPSGGRQERGQRTHSRQRAPGGCYQEKESLPDGHDSVETDLEKFFGFLLLFVLIKTLGNISGN